jgi:ribosome-associated heat shock protein Hsp15
VEKVRVDRWLWSVRIFKSRSIATDACKNRKIKIDDKPVKASYLLKGDELLQVQKEGFNLKIQVVELINKRVSAALAEPCYNNMTPLEELNKYKDWFIGKAVPEKRERGAGRPTKRERRELDGFKDETFFLGEE